MELTIMFKKTLNLSQLKREINDLLGDLTGDDALQVVHRGKQIKVIITQERYFKLLGELAQRTVVEPGDLTADVPSTIRKQALKQKLEKASDGDRTKINTMDQARIRTT
jgi:hypothetical protein